MARVFSRRENRVVPGEPAPVLRPEQTARYIYASGRRFRVYDAHALLETEGRYEGFRDDHIRKGEAPERPRYRSKNG